MAAYRRVDDLYSHLQADCLYTGISSGPIARYRVWEAFTFFSICSIVASCGQQLLLLLELWDQLFVIWSDAVPSVL